ncbi:MAG: thioesterase family protein [Thermoplasmata archaeon]|nr:thioesterase family protein [Thermoplasmata archaeon]
MTEPDQSGRFERRFRVGWGDVDGNAHMANTAFLDRAADTRMLFFADHGFPVARLAAEHLGPVIVRDELVYRKELRLLEEFAVDLVVIGLSADGVRFHLGNTFCNGAGEVAAVVASEGLWFDLDTRRPRPPPPELDAAQRTIPRSDRFREIPSRPP